MQITHAEDSDQASNAIRGGAREFKTLLRGEDGSLSNYKLSFVRQSGELDIPRHKHNFDQIRMCLEGEPQNYGKNKWIDPGEIVYFPEGTPYGPEQSTSHRLSITLQFGGASGNGYIGSKAAQAGVEELQLEGTFSNGIFTRNGELAPGQKRNQDSYEAIWEHVNGRKLKYPKPRFEEPVCMRPANFNWLPDPSHPGLSEKALAVFSERTCMISMLKLDAHAKAPIAWRSSVQIGFIVSGQGWANGEAIRKYSAFSLSPNEQCTLATDGGLELLVVGLHRLIAPDQWCDYDHSEASK